MKKTLKRELKLFEIVESDAFVVSVSAFAPPFLSGCMWSTRALCALESVKLEVLRAGASYTRNCNGGEVHILTSLRGTVSLVVGRGQSLLTSRVALCIELVVRRMTHCQFFPNAFLCD